MISFNIHHLCISNQFLSSSCCIQIKTAKKPGALNMFPRFLLAGLALFVSVLGAYSANIVCYYDSKSFYRNSQGKMQATDLEPALAFCNYIMYGYAGINEQTHKLVSLNENLDITKNNYHAVTDLKRRYPGLRIMLTVGGNADDENPEKYMTLIESAETRIAFINSAHTLVKAYGFDGLDLAWQFPPNKPKKIRGTISSLWHGLKKKVTGDSVLDEKAAEHKEQFVAFTRELKNVFRHDGLLLSLTVLPNVNSSMFYDARALAQHLDFVNLMGFDYYTPKRNPKEADYPAPLYEQIDRNPVQNANHLVQHWLSNGFPAAKMNLGIPTYGLSWRMGDDSGLTGVPPFKGHKAGAPGPYTNQEGLLSYPEVCAKINSPVTAKGNEAKLRKVGDPSKRYGTYAFRLADEHDDHGLWVAYEDPETAGNKAAYAKSKGLGGVAIFDVTLDDFRGLCTGDKYPILRGAKFRL